MMKTKTDILVGAAKNWWSLLRPEGWTIDRHIKEPFINTNGKHEKQLAGAVAKVVQEQRENSLEKFKQSARDSVGVT